MNDNIFKVILAMIPLVGAVLTGFVIPWLKAKVSTEKLNQYMTWAKQAVQCAEMIYPIAASGSAKKAYVREYLQDLIGGKLTDEQIDILIESAVKELKLAEKEASNG